MNAPLTKEQLYDLQRKWCSAGPYSDDDPRYHMLELLDSHALVDEALTRFRQRVYLSLQVDIDCSDHSTACTIWGDDGQGHTTENFTEPLPCNCGALQNWERKQRLKAEQERNLLAKTQTSLLERLKRAEAIVESYKAAKAAEIPWDVKERIRAARAKEGKE